MSEPQAPEVDEPTDPQEPERFEHVVKAAVEGVHPAYIASLSQPTEAQLLVLVRMADMVDDSPLNAVRLYSDAIEALMLPEESHRLQRGLLRGHLTPEDFVEVGPAAIRHYFPELMENRAQKTHGPAATRRPKKAKR